MKSLLILVRRKLTITALALAAVVMPFIASAAPGVVQTPALRIAVIDPMSGPLGVIGQDEMANLQFIGNSINRHGGVDGHVLKFTAFDNNFSAKETVTQFQKGLAQGIRYFVLETSAPMASALLHAIDLHNAHDPHDPALFLDNGANFAVFTNKLCSPWFFLFDANTTMKEALVVKWVATRKDIHKVFVIAPSDPYGYNFAENVKKFLHNDAPGVKIVGTVFHALNTIKDYTPYITQIKASGAQAVISADWGEDSVLQVKAAGELGLKIPFVTLYANSPGAVTAIGKAGVGRVYLLWLNNGDYKNTQMARWQTEMKAQTGVDFADLRGFYLLHMLAAAAKKAHSIAPLKVAPALEGITVRSPAGVGTMRAEDHQLQVPMYMNVLADHMRFGVEKTKGLNWHAIYKFPATEGELPTTCHMKRPWN